MKPRVNFILCDAGMNRAALNAFQLCNRLEERGYPVSVTALGRGYEHAWFPLRARPRYAEPPPASRRALKTRDGEVHLIDLSPHQAVDRLPAAIPSCDVNIAMNATAVHAAAESGRGEVWLWMQRDEALFLDQPHEKLLAESAMRLPSLLLASSSPLAARWRPMAEARGAAREAHLLLPGIDPAFYRPGEAAAPARGEERTVICLGEEGDWKGAETLEMAAAAVLDRRRDVRFLCCGSAGPAGGRPPRMEFAQIVSPRAWAEAFRKADVVVGCYPDGASAFAPLEAMACGAPVVTARSVAEDYAEDGADAFLVETGDHDAVARRILALLDDADLARALGRSGSRRAGGFSWDTSADAVEPLLRAS